jgi:hypothetical protein
VEEEDEEEQLVKAVNKKINITSKSIKKAVKENKSHSK